MSSWYWHPVLNLFYCFLPNCFVFNKLKSWLYLKVFISWAYIRLTCSSFSSEKCPVSVDNKSQRINNRYWKESKGPSRLLYFSGGNEKMEKSSKQKFKMVETLVSVLVPSCWGQKWGTLAVQFEPAIDKRVKAMHLHARLVYPSAISTVYHISTWCWMTIRKHFGSHSFIPHILLYQPLICNEQVMEWKV